MIVTRQMRDEEGFVLHTAEGGIVSMGHHFNTDTEELAVLVGEPVRMLELIGPDGTRKSKYQLGKAEFQWMKLPGAYVTWKGERFEHT